MITNLIQVIFAVTVSLMPPSSPKETNKKTIPTKLFKITVSSEPKILSELHVPINYKLKIEKTLYVPNPKWNPMGDGNHSYIAKISESSLQSFINNYVKNNYDWSHGNIPPNGLLLECVEWLLKWKGTNEFSDKIKSTIGTSLEKYKRPVYYKITDKRKNSGGFFTDIECWVIFPELCVIIKFQFNT
jgi:hypothetical protein